MDEQAGLQLCFFFLFIGHVLRNPDLWFVTRLGLNKLLSYREKNMADVIFLKEIFSIIIICKTNLTGADHSRWMHRLVCILLRAGYEISSRCLNEGASDV